MFPPLLRKTVLQELFGSEDANGPFRGRICGFSGGVVVYFCKGIPGLPNVNQEI